VFPALYFFGIGALNCLATRGFPTIGNELFPGMRNENSQLEVTLDVKATLEKARQRLSPIRDLRPELYSTAEPVPFS
jgi:hypothetical protein